MKRTDFKWILKKWLSWISWSFHNHLQEICYNFPKNTNFKTCLESTQTVESDTSHNCRDTHVNDTGAPRRKGCCSPTLASTQTAPPEQNTISTRPKNDSTFEWGPSAARRTTDQRAETPCTPRSGRQRHWLERGLHCIVWNTEEEGEQNRAGAGKTTINSNFLPQVLLSEFTILNLSTRPKSTLSVSLNNFFSCFTWTIAIF